MPRMTRRPRTDSLNRAPPWTMRWPTAETSLRFFQHAHLAVEQCVFDLHERGRGGGACRPDFPFAAVRFMGEKPPSMPMRSQLPLAIRDSSFISIS